MVRSLRQGSSEGRSSRKTSVVGSTLGEASSRLRARGVPRSGIPTQDGLKVAEGALPDSSMGLGVVSARKAGHSILRLVAIISGSLVVLLLVFALVLAILSRTSMFQITSIETYDTEHVKAEDVAQLIRLEPGATLLNVDIESVEKAVLNNPWIASVEIQSSFPDRLLVRTQERTVGGLVAMRSGGICWLLGSDGVWIEPTRVEAQEGSSSDDAALAEAERIGVVMIYNVPASVSPVAGSRCTDEPILAALSLAEQFPQDFRDMVVSYAAPDEDGISCILASGVEVSFGSPTNVETKVAVAKKILEEYAGQVTYVNVRVPSRPTYRRVGSTYVREGTGATGVAVDEESDFASYPQREPEEDEDELDEDSDDSWYNYINDVADADSSDSDSEYSDSDSDDYSSYGYDEYDSTY